MAEKYYFFDSTPIYYYIYDHIGYIREVARDDNERWQVTDYYPFGAPYDMSFNVQYPSLQPYRYNGKELDRMHGLDWYDYGARHYDAALGRWMSMDPLCEKYYSVSPYAYCHNNPVNRIDPNGKTDYFLYANGLIKHGTFNNNKVDRLYAIGTKNNISVGKGILHQFLHKKNANGHSANIQNATDAFKIFKFVADNSNVEWSLRGFSTNIMMSYQLSTSNLGGKVTSTLSDASICNLKFSLHSHPRYGGQDQASGFDIDNGSSTIYEGIYHSGDRASLITILGTYQKYKGNANFPEFYIYNAKSHNIFQYDWERSSFGKHRVYNSSQLKNDIE